MSNDHDDYAEITIHILGEEDTTYSLNCFLKDNGRIPVSGDILDTDCHYAKSKYLLVKYVVIKLCGDGVSIYCSTMTDYDLYQKIEEL